MYNFCTEPKKQHRKFVAFLDEHKHLQKFKVCICCKGCSYSTIQLCTLPIAQQNVDQAAWGKVIWKMIHTIARHHHAKLMEIFESLLLMLPCVVCRENFHVEVQAFKNFVCTKHNAEKGAWELHNKVSARLNDENNAKKKIMSWEEYCNIRDTQYCKHIDILEVLRCLEMQVRNSADIVRVAPVRKAKNTSVTISNIDFLKLKLCRAHLLQVMNDLHTSDDTESVMTQNSIARGMQVKKARHVANKRQRQMNRKKGSRTRFLKKKWRL